MTTLDLTFNRHRRCSCRLEAPFHYGVTSDGLASLIHCTVSSRSQFERIATEQVPHVSPSAETQRSRLLTRKRRRRSVTNCVVFGLKINLGTVADDDGVATFFSHQLGANVNSTACLVNTGSSLIISITELLLTGSISLEPTRGCTPHFALVALLCSVFWV